MIWQLFKKKKENSWKQVIRTVLSYSTDVGTLNCFHGIFSFEIKISVFPHCVYWITRKVVTQHDMTFYKRDKIMNIMNGNNAIMMMVVCNCVCLFLIGWKAFSSYDARISFKTLHCWQVCPSWFRYWPCHFGGAWWKIRPQQRRCWFSTFQVLWWRSKAERRWKPHLHCGNYVLLCILYTLYSMEISVKDYCFVFTKFRFPWNHPFAKHFLVNIIRNELFS